MTANVDILLARLEGVRPYGQGWRAKCPACGGKSRDKVSIAVGNNGGILVHCFSGCTSLEVVQAAGLTLADLMPEREAADTPEDRRRNRLLMRQVGWGGALDKVGQEASVVLIAAREILGGHPLSETDLKRVAKAVAVIEGACDVLLERRKFRPGAEVAGT